MLLLPAKNWYIWPLFHFFFFLFWSKGKRKPEKMFGYTQEKGKAAGKQVCLKKSGIGNGNKRFFFFRFSYCKSTFSVPLQIVILAFPEQILKIFHFCMGYKAYFSTLWLWIFLQLVIRASSCPVVVCKFNSRTR